jgi:hypothetical protein
LRVGAVKQESSLFEVFVNIELAHFFKVAQTFNLCASGILTTE